MNYFTLNFWFWPWTFYSEHHLFIFGFDYLFFWVWFTALTLIWYLVIFNVLIFVLNEIKNSISCCSLLSVCFFVHCSPNQILSLYSPFLDFCLHFVSFKVFESMMLQIVKETDAVLPPYLVSNMCISWTCFGHIT